MRVTFVQYGDFFEAAHSFDDGGDETYAAQRYSVDLVRALKCHCEDVCVVCVTASYPERILPDGVRTIGINLYHDGDETALANVVAQQRPTHLICRTPVEKILRWSARQNVATLPLMATSFPRGGPITWLRHRRMAQAFNSPHIRWIGNHSTNSAKDLRRIGVDPCRIVPWDWPATIRPGDWPAKDGPRSPDGLRVFFAGRVIETKGVGDCIRSIDVLRQKGRVAHLTVAGAGDIEEFRQLAETLSVTAHVHFLGRIAHREVVRLMHEHDVVVVPSRHAFPEGLPMTIYDAYASRSPLVASDHPMFRSRVRDAETALVFAAGDATALSRCFERLASDPALYAKLSHDSAAAWARLQLPVKWGDMLTRWLRDAPDDRRWLEEHSLARYDYSV